MFTSFDKAIVAILMAAAYILSEFGIGLPEWANEGFFGSVGMVIGSILVYIVPNKSP